MTSQDREKTRGMGEVVSFSRDREQAGPAFDAALRQRKPADRVVGYDTSMILKQLKLGEDWGPEIHRWRRAPQSGSALFFRKMLENRCSLALFGDRLYYVKGVGHRGSRALIRRVDVLCALSLNEPLISFRLDHVVLDRRIAPPTIQKPTGEVVFQNQDFVITRYLGEDRGMRITAGAA